MITVTAAIILKENKILAARRQAGSHMAGHWEFPGGKVEPGESEKQCLTRELLEEFNVHCSVEKFFMESIYDYGTKIIKLRGYITRHLSGSFECRVHDSVVWLSQDKMTTLTWAPADVPLVKKIAEGYNF